MKSISDQWTRDEREKAALMLALQIKKKILQNAAYSDEIRHAIFRMADTQTLLLTVPCQFLEENREQIETDCKI